MAHDACIATPANIYAELINVPDISDSPTRFHRPELGLTRQDYSRDGNDGTGMDSHVASRDWREERRRMRTTYVDGDEEGGYIHDKGSRRMKGWRWRYFGRHNASSPESSSARPAEGRIWIVSALRI